MSQETEVVQPKNEQVETQEEVKAETPKEQTFTQAQIDNIIKTRLEAEKQKNQKVLQEEENKKNELLKEQQLKEAKSKAEVEKVMQERLSEKELELNRYKEQIKKENDFEKQNRNFAGSRRAHVRKLPDGYKSSKVQMLLAKKLDVYLPPNYNYVKESKYGENGMPKREIIYRSKSLNGIFYYTKSEKSEFDKINEMSPAGFEEYCHQIIEKNGWKVYKNNPIDGGIDVRALKENKDGSVKTLLVQCKHWRKPIPPGAVRDFKAGADDEKVEGIKELMFISFSKFSPGAKEYALKHNIMLVDGDHLITKGKIKYDG